MNNSENNGNGYDFDPLEIQQTVLQDNYAQAIIACEVERRVAITYQNLALSLVSAVIALICFGAGIMLLNVTGTINEPVTINTRQPL